MKPDTTELDEVKKQLRDTELALVQSEKMASLGNLVAGVAHEINTPVGSIYSNSDLMMKALAKLRKICEETDALADQRDLPRVLDALDNVGSVNQTACQRIVSIVKSLKTFARIEEPDCRRADLHQELENALTLVHHELKDRIVVEKDYGTLPEIECHPNHLNQVFMNLLVNACHAIDGKGRIRISTKQAGDSIQVRIQDSGRGIAPENVDRVFEYGFTTKGVGVGTGLGLPISCKIVHAHHGHIDVTSTEGEGTTFTITLPIDAPEAAGPKKGDP